MLHRLLLVLLAATSCYTCSPKSATAISIISPTDPILAISAGGGASGSTSPANEPVARLFDGLFLASDYTTTPAYSAKYFNGGGAGAGFIITPATANTVLRSFTYTTANDSPERNPTSFRLWGTNDSVKSPNHSQGLYEAWNFIASGTLTPGTSLFTTHGPVSFENSKSYSSYRLIFPTLNGGAGTGLQLGEVTLHQTANASDADLGDSYSALVPIRHTPSTTANAGGTTLAGEGVAQVIDGDPDTKMLNTGGALAGFIVTPGYGASAVNGFRITTANDAVSRDPTSWRIFGTNDAITSVNNSTGMQENWQLIDQGSVALPTERNVPTAVIPINNAGGIEYTSYKVEFPTNRGDAYLQISEFELFEADPIKLVVDRNTGEVTLESTTAVTISSYEITSNVYGGLNYSGWEPIAGSPKDANDTWEVGGTASSGSVMEADAASGANDGSTITPGSPLSLGQVFLSTPYEDLGIYVYDLSGTLISQTVEYVGSPIVAGDLTGDSFIDINDYNAFIEGAGGYYPELSRAETYLLGDIDGDKDVDAQDFQQLLRAAGGIEALLSSASTVPEPGTALLFLGGAFAVGWRRVRSLLVLALAPILCGFSVDVYAVSYVSLGVPSSIYTPDPVRLEGNPVSPRNPNFLFDDSYLEDSLNTELFNFNYNSPDEGIIVGNQYVGVGRDPKRIFFDYGTTKTANSFALAQRSGALPSADRIGKFEFWFSQSPFGANNDQIPATQPDSIYYFDPDDTRLLDSYLRPYPLAQDFTFQYAAMRITESEVSADQIASNIGASEFRFTDGPSPVVLEVNRETGTLTLINNGPNAQHFDIRALEIESPLGGLDADGYTGLRGVPGSPFASAGWAIGAGSGDYHLLESVWSTTTSLAPGSSYVLGTGYNTSLNTEDLLFRFAESSTGDYLGPDDDGESIYGQAHLFDGVVRYVGAAPENDPGDFNADGIVNLADYTVWRDNLGGDASAIHFNGSGGATVTAADYDVWKSNFGVNYGPLSGLAGSSAVPEPTTLAMCGLAIAAALVARRARQVA